MKTNCAIQDNADLYIYYIHFEITGYPWLALSNVINSQIKLFFAVNRIIHVLKRIISFLNRTIFALYRIISVSRTKWDVKAFLFSIAFQQSGQLDQ